MGSFSQSSTTRNYTPKHGSWLNQAEIEISRFSGKASVGAGLAWNRMVNRKKVKIDWTFDRKRARKKFKYHYERPKT
jgi:nuclear transport factor 2 (NTF2) superfamily protein